MEDFIPTDDDFTPVYSSQQHLPFVGRPRDGGKFSCFTAPDGFVAYIAAEVLATLIEEAKYTDERMGLLAGRVLNDEEGPYTLVLSSESAQENELDASPSRVRLSGPGSIKVRQRLENRAYGLDIIGWYHTHPTFTARFSSVDTIEQSTWQDSNHIGIVVSGLQNSERFGVYRGPKAMALALAPQNSTRSLAVKPPPTRNALPATRVGAALGLDRHDVSQPSVQVSQPNVAATLRRKRFSRISAWAVVIGAVTTIFGLGWLEYRTRKLEQVQSESARQIADMRAALVPSPANSSPAPPGSEDSGSKTVSGGKNQVASGTGDLPANPKRSVSTLPGRSKIEKPRTGSDHPSNANRSLGNANRSPDNGNRSLGNANRSPDNANRSLGNANQSPGNANRSPDNASVPAGNTGGDWQSAAPNQTPKPTPSPSSRSSSTPPARPGKNQ